MNTETEEVTINQACAGILEKLLSGDRDSADVRAHMEVCADCRAAAEALAMLNAVPGKTLPEPPAHLDDAIRNAAADAIHARNHFRSKIIPFIFRAGGIAAVLAAAFLVIHFNVPAAPDQPEQTAKADHFTPSQITASDWDMTELNSDLATFYGEMRAATEKLSQTDIHTTKLEYGYVAYARSGIND